MSFSIASIVLLLPLSLVAGDVETLDSVIEALQEHLTAQKALRDHLIRYQQLHADYLKDTSDNEKLFKLVKAAHQLHQEMKESHVDHIFSKELLSELSLFSQVAAKRGIPKS